MYISFGMKVYCNQEMLSMKLTNKKIPNKSISHPLSSQIPVYHA